MANATATTGKTEIIPLLMCFLKRFACLFCAPIVALFLTSCTEISSKGIVSHRSEVAKIVNSLGNSKNENQDFKNNARLLQQLKPHSKIAVEILLEELKPVTMVKLDDPKNGSNENKEARHMVLCFRALYYLTGQKMLASSSYKLTDSEYDINRSGLAVKNNGKWAFFTEWMSRGTIYFAPMDAQQKIIQDWKTWASKNLQTYNFPENVAFDDWYFGGPE